MVSRKGPSTGKRGTGTIAGDRGNQVLSQEAARLYKTQDLGYVRTMRNKTQKEVDQLERRVAGIKGQGMKVVYVDWEEEVGKRMLDGEKGNVGSGDDEGEDEDEDLEARKIRKLREREADKLQSKLSVAKERLKALADAEEALDLQRAKMAKSPTAGGINKAGVKFKVRERKR